ncbi:MAG: alpha/beta hydrolase [Ginsengibacter sp.]
MQKGQSIQYRNKIIYYRVIGKGRPVVLIHGFGENGNIWNELIKNLQNNFLLIIPDLPGSGNSEMLDGENVSIEDYADVIKTILNEELPKVSPPAGGGDLEGAVTLIGHSMGGYITLAFAEKYPDLLNGFGLFHSSAFADDEEKKQTRRKAIDFIIAKGSYSFLRTSIPNLFTGKEHLKEMEDIIEEGKKFKPEALIQYYQAMINRPDRTKFLKTFKKPILFIIGEKDNAIPLQASLQQCHQPSISHVHILDIGHMGMIEESAGSSAIVESFLQNILTIN